MVSHIKPLNIMLLNEVELVKLGLNDSASHNVNAYRGLINLTLLMRIFQFENILVPGVQIMNTSLVKRECWRM